MNASLRQSLGTSNEPHSTLAGRDRGTSQMFARAAGSRHFQSRGGNIMPRPQYRTDDVARAQGEILRDRYGRLKSPAKEQAAETGQSVRACRNQQAGMNCMQLTEFFNACQVIPELKRWGMQMMGCESETDPEFVQAMTMAMNVLARRGSRS